MTSWSDFATDAPDLAGRVRERFGAHRHHTMATLRRDGSPRISGTEVSFEGEGLYLGMMAGARRAADLAREPRIALHSQGVDPPVDNPGGWPGEAKLSGTATAVAGRGGPGGAHWFRVDLTEVVLTGMGSPPDHLVIEWWTPGRGVVRFERR